jgi:decaprenyl-phosphate phosphoribosyltransferase
VSAEPTAIGVAVAGPTRAGVRDAAAAGPGRSPGWLVSVLRTARPRQWPKNLLVFAAPLAAASAGRDEGLAYALLAAAAFGLASVAVYFVNDVADAERDRQHPRKRHRPIAAGDLPKPHAFTLGAACAAAGVSVGLMIGEPLLAAAVGGYLGMSFLYSGLGKHIPVIELIFVASGFLRRVLGGAAATHVPPSVWQSRLTTDRISICAGTLDPPTNLKTVQAWWTDRASDYHARPALQEFATE